MVLMVSPQGIRLLGVVVLQGRFVKAKLNMAQLAGAVFVFLLGRIPRKIDRRSGVTQDGALLSSLVTQDHVGADRHKHW